MPKAKKLPSGNWKVRIYDYVDAEGKQHMKSFTAATKKDAELLAANYTRQQQAQVSDVTFIEAMDEYIAARTNVASPATIRGYKQMRSYYEPIGHMKVSKINQMVVTRFINTFASTHSPKTCSNAHGLLSAILKEYRPDLTLKTKLPAKKKIVYSLPLDEHIDKLITYFKENDKDMLYAVYLAAFGTLRRSEICALTSEDVKGTTVHVSKGMKIDDKREWQICSPKTTGSDRYVSLPDFVIQELPKEGKLVNLHPDQITSRFGRTLKRLDIPHCRFHDLRHYAASIMHALGIPDQYVMQMGGWQSDKVLKDIYRGTLTDYEEKFNNIRNEHFEKFKK